MAPITCPECRYEGRPEHLMHVARTCDDGTRLWRCDVCEYEGFVFDIRPHQSVETVAQ